MTAKRPNDRLTLRRVRRLLETLSADLDEEALEWRADHPDGDEDEVDYASGVLSAKHDLDMVIGVVRRMERGR